VAGPLINYYTNADFRPGWLIFLFKFYIFFEDS
jgi:hypothetical protein